MSNIINIKTHTPRSGENYFFDCNIWLFNFCPIGNYSQNQQQAYSSFLNDVKANRATIFVNSLVLSEFANRYLRLDFNRWVKSPDCQIANPEFKKDYISSERYTLLTGNVKSAISNILRLVEKTSDDFHRIGNDLNGVFNNFEYIDFNDSYYYEFCKKNNFILVSDDQDFKKIEDNSVKIISIPRE